MRKSSKVAPGESRAHGEDELRSQKRIEELEREKAELLGATSGPESAPVKKVVEVIEFEIPVGFVASIDDVPS